MPKPITYISTRGGNGETPIGFSQVLINGLARDGGLYLPAADWPHFTRGELTDMAEMPYYQVAAQVLAKFTAADFGLDDLTPITQAAYADFGNPAIAPTRQLDEGLHVCELFHGPTLAFKDMAMQPLARLFDKVLADRKQQAVILAATSGDTGSAALWAFAGRPNVKAFVLYPKGRVSPIQEAQMTSITAGNCHAVAVGGDFDDCQAIVKTLFAHGEFRDEVKLAAVNSINWGRIIAQITYYITAALACGGLTKPVSFAVPSGNFGNIFAGFVAKKMGAPIRRLVCASNRNDILTRFFESLIMERRPTQPSLSPSMDIQVASNFERLLFELLGRDAAATRQHMQDFADNGRFAVKHNMLAADIDLFAAARFDDSQTLAEIKRTWQASKVLLDPHSAIGVAAARDLLAKAEAETVIALATAHPAKFPEAVAEASGIHPPLPNEVAAALKSTKPPLSAPAEAAAVAKLIRQHI